MNKFTNKLIEARTKKKMLKKDVAQLFGWTPMYYGRYENGQTAPTKVNMKLFANFMGITVEELKKIIKEDRESDSNENKKY